MDNSRTLLNCIEERQEPRCKSCVSHELYGRESRDCMLARQEMGLGRESSFQLRSTYIL